MKASRSQVCILAFLLGAASFRSPQVRAEEELDDIARKAFAEFQKQAPEMTGPENPLQMVPTVTRHATFWQCSDAATSLCVDLRGNACYARVHGWLPDAQSGGKGSSRPVNGRIDVGALVQRTQELAKRWLSDEELRSAKPAVKREILLLAQLPSGKIATTPGRIIIRLVGKDDIGFGWFQAVFDPHGALHRLDVSFTDARTRDLCNSDLLATAPSAKRTVSEKPLTLGCFFDPSEYRFEISAFAVEGEPFLNLAQAAGNPFARDNFDLKHAHRVSVASYRKSQDYHWWCWAWWRHYGCVSSFRGNWVESQGGAGWEFPDHLVLHHRSLADYPVIQGPPRQTKTIQQSDGPSQYPYAINQTFTSAFYKDLEQCNIAFFFTHGGPIQSAYQLRRGLDMWVRLTPPGRKLGVDKLRHLFLDGCAAFTYFREPQAAHLVKTWIRQAPASGLRTACGVDGGASLLDRGGWRFFGYYNKGDSISDAWAFALLDEFVENYPVTAAYGDTISEAAEFLLRGRFTDEKARAKAVAISVWSNSGTQ